MLSYNLSQFVPIFKKIDKKLAQIKGVFHFYGMKNYTRNFPEFLYSRLPVIRTSTGDRNLVRITECSNN